MLHGAKVQFLSQLFQHSSEFGKVELLVERGRKSGSDVSMVRGSQLVIVYKTG